LGWLCGVLDFVALPDAMRTVLALAAGRLARAILRSPSPVLFLHCGHGCGEFGSPLEAGNGVFLPALLVQKGELSLNGIFDRPIAFVSMNEFGRARSESLMKRAASWE